VVRYALELGKPSGLSVIFQVHLEHRDEEAVERRLLRCGLDFRGHKVDVDIGPRHLERSVRLVPAWPQQMQEHTRDDTHGVARSNFTGMLVGVRARACVRAFSHPRESTHFQLSRKFT
jgi:hypothetical protein